MELMLKVLQIVAPVFILAGLGFGWVRIGFEYRVAFVTRLAMWLGIPALIFSALVKTEIAPAVLGTAALAALAGYALLGAAAFGIVALAGLDRRIFVAPLIFGNTGNLGLPLALFAFGAAGLDFAVVVFAVTILLQFTVGLWLVSGKGAWAQPLKEPILGATLLGGVFLVNGWTLPGWAMNTVDLVGQLGIPLMLLTLGVAISRLRPGAVGRAVWLSLARLAAGLASGLAAGLAFGLPPVALGVVVLQISAPVAVTTYLVAEQYTDRAEEVAGLVVVSTLIAVFAIPATLAFFV